MRNDVPRPTSVSKSMAPLCNWTVRNVLASSRSAAAGRVVKEELEDAIGMLGRDSASRVFDLDHGHFAVPLQV